MRYADVELLRCSIRERIRKDGDIDLADFDDNFNMQMARIYTSYPEEDIIKTINRLLEEELNK